MTELLKLDAVYVAQLIGLDLVDLYDQLPAGFRLNFQDAADAGVFKSCENLGQQKKAYCDFICRGIE